MYTILSGIRFCTWVCRSCLSPPRLRTEESAFTASLIGAMFKMLMLWLEWIWTKITQRQHVRSNVTVVTHNSCQHLMSQSFTPLSHSCSSSFVVFRTLLRRFAVAYVKRGMAGVTRISVDVQVWSVDADAIAAPGLILWCSRQSSLAEEVFWSHSFLDKATPGWHTAVMVGWYSTVQYSTQALGTFRSL